MTNRGRITATLRCEATDRPPLINWLGTGGWRETLVRWRDESGISDLNLSVYFGYDRGFLFAPLEYGAWPRFEHTVLEEDDRYETYVDYRGITIRNRKDGNTLPEYITNPVCNRADWERYKDARLQPVIEERTAGLEEWIESIRKIDAPVQVGTFPYGCFGMPRDVLGVENLLITYYDDPGMVKDIIDTHVEIWLALYASVSEEIDIDHVHMWEDMSGKQGSLISMDMVREFMMPSYDRIASFARAHGVSAFSVDSDGYVNELVAVMHEHGVNSFFPFEVQAGSDIVKTRSSYPGLSVWGGLDKRALAAGQTEMHRELQRAEELFTLGGYIAGFDHSVPPDVPWHNFCYFMSELKKIIGL